MFDPKFDPRLVANYAGNKATYSNDPWWGIYPPSEDLVGDFPSKPFDKNDFYSLPKVPYPELPKPVEWNKILKKLLDKTGSQNPNGVQPLPEQQALDDKNNFFPQEDGNLVFVMEVPGYGEEHFSIKIKNDGNPYLEIEASNDDRMTRDTFYIPDAMKYDLHSGEVIVEYGILTITFEAATYKNQEIVLL